MAKKTTTPTGKSPEQVAEENRQKRAEAAEKATAIAKEEGRLPETMAVTNPAPATEMDAASGAFIEPEIKKAIPVDHPAIENNPRAGTSAVQNGGDFNDPRRRHPSDPDFVGQGLDLSVYGNKSDE
ncbi:hypothetical protein LH464_05290 [Neorhizobium sp. T786]|uniref:hypothetical protein n=1 Tax=Pseudorhizobium xiangyangii TaxID=2883104 RepID=UPI001CFFD655|nr:hypothetical protein [Neorhizobium xiangyangii]MCB5201892.1 hypothetical protein [Neorhizobium xiangyangii]